MFDLCFYVVKNTSLVGKFDKIRLFLTLMRSVIDVQECDARQAK
jgi:hypothetical protein